MHISAHITVSLFSLIFLKKFGETEKTQRKEVSLPLSLVFEKKPRKEEEEKSFPSKKVFFVTEMLPVPNRKLMH